MRFVYALLVNCWLLLVWPLRWLLRLRAAPRGAWLEVELDGALPEVDRAVPFWDRRPRPLSLQSLRRLIEVAADDSRVTGLVLKIRTLGGGSATATALRSVLLGARRRGKRLAVYLPAGAGTSELLVASAADRLLLGPETYLAPLGFALQAPYVKDALDRVGIQPEIFARGRYKTAGESLVRCAMSAEQREQLEAYLDVAWDVLLDALACGRDVSRTLAEQWVNQGVWSARTAVIQGLADGVAHEDELASRVDPENSAGAALVPGARYLRRRVLRWRPLRRPRCIAVIELHGPIAPGRSHGLVPFALEQDVRESMRRAAEDRRVAGVVVHINSPGGSALSSQLLLHELRRVAERKPVVACLGDVAASGGYLVACGAHVIYAQPSSLTGSIGVVAARVLLQPLLQRLGVGVQVVQKGERANMFSPVHQLDQSERETLERQMEEVYQSFLQAVAVGRRKAPAEIEPLAGGRIHSGRAATASGLVDALGGFDDALAEVRRRLGPGAERLQPCLLSPRWAGLRRRPLPRLAGAVAELLGLESLSQVAALAWADPREQLWLYCPVTERDLTGRSSG